MTKKLGKGVGTGVSERLEFLWLPQWCKGLNTKKRGKGHWLKDVLQRMISSYLKTYQLTIS